MWLGLKMCLEPQSLSFVVLMAAVHIVNLVKNNNNKKPTKDLRHITSQVPCLSQDHPLSLFPAAPDVSKRTGKGERVPSRSQAQGNTV